MRNETACWQEIDEITLLHMLSLVLRTVLVATGIRGLNIFLNEMLTTGMGDCVKNWKDFKRPMAGADMRHQFS